MAGLEKLLTDLQTSSTLMPPVANALAFAPCVIELRQLVQPFIERDERGRFLGRKDEAFVERKVLQTCASFFATHPAGMVHQDVAHHLGGQTDKMRPALPVRLAVFHQLQKSLVQQGGGLERIIMPLRPHVSVSDLAKLGFYHRKEPIGAALIARSPTLEQLGNGFGRSIALLVSVALPR